MPFTPNLTLLRPLLAQVSDNTEAADLLAFFEGEHAKLVTSWPEQDAPLAFASITYLDRFKSAMVATGKFTPDEIGEIMMHARGYAGGVASGEARRKVEPPEEEQPLAAHEGYFQFNGFAELSGGPKPDQWFQITPPAGHKFKHPRYGEVSFSQDRAKRMVGNFDTHVYQEHIPIDAEHETKLSGATGYYKAMRVRADGAVEAQIDFNERGKTLLAGGGFKYFSPEFFQKWTDPATGTVHEDVVVGGALTSRPYFKDQHLAPLIAANEYDVWKHTEGAPKVARFKTDDKGALVLENGEPVLTDEAVAEMAAEAVKAHEAKTKPAEKTPEAVKFAEQFPEQAAALISANERIATMQHDGLIQRFTDMVRGRSEGDDGAPWQGEVAKNVGLLVKMSETFGEGSEEFAYHVSQQRQFAKNARQTSETKPSAFGARSSSARAAGDKSAEEQLLAFAEEISKGTDLSPEEALTQAIAKHPELYGKHVEETQVPTS